MTNHAAAYGTFTALALALSAPAFAQDATDEEGIRDIIVTAQKREESIQSVPIAVSAIDEQALATSSVKDIRDFAGRVPSLVIDSVNAGPRGAGISLRGISFEDIEKSFDPAVGVVVDGVFIGTNTGQLLDVFDLEAIEVLRGPQGTLFGRNTIGGVINIRRSKPTGEFGVKGSIGYAEFDTWRGRGVINTPKIGDFLSLKGFLYYDKTGGYYRNVTQNNRQGEYEVLTGGVTALIEPTDNISLNITYEHVRERGETVVTPISYTPNLAFGPTNDLICLQVPVPGVGLVRAFGIPSVQCDRSTLGRKALYTIFQNIATPVRNDGNNVYAELNIDIGDFTLTSVTGYQRNKESVRQDFDATSINFFDTLRRQVYRQTSEELRLTGDLSDGINILIGGYYFDSRYTLRQNTNIGFTTPPASTFQLSTGKAESYAVFGDARIDLTDAFQIDLGGRYTHDKKSLVTNFGLSPDGSCPTFFGIPASACSGRATFNKFTYRGSVNYKVGQNKLIYASYSTGYRSGGFNGRASTPTSIGPYQPETVKSAEIGLKADWLDRTLRTNLALFTTRYQNKQEESVEPSPPPFNAINPQQTVVRNAASAKIDGFEAEITAQPVPELTFTGTFAYTDARYRRFFRDVNGDFIPDDVSTLNLRRSPKFTWSLAMDYRREVGSGTFGLSTNFRFTDKYATCISADPIALRAGRVINDVRCESDTREILDATLSYALAVGDRGEVKFSVFGRNLFDDRGIGAALPVAGLFTFAGARPPRQLGAEIAFKF